MQFLLLIALGVLSTSAYETQNALDEFVSGSTQFTADVYSELKSTSGNFLVCPLSANVILALVRAGARGKTAQELSTCLHLPDNTKRIEQIFTEITPHLQGNDQFTLSSANKIYVKDEFNISDSFRKTAVVFNAEVQNIDFENGEQAATEMNNWVAAKTDNKIQNLINPKALNEDTFAVLINAIYFHGKWATKFDKDNTRKRTFQNINAEQTEISMMELTNWFNYYESDELNAKFLEMPYKGGEITMHIVLPNDVEGLPALEARIADVLAEPKYYTDEVYVVLPKFKTETTIDFNAILKARGVKKAYSDSANFSGIGSDQEPLKLSKVIQKAFIEVEEEGTTAAAATMVSMDLNRSILSSPPPKEFIADHPFIYYLKSSSAGIMFIGRFSEG